MNRPANRTRYLAGNRAANRPGYLAGSSDRTESLTESGTESPHVRAIASRPVPSCPNPSRPNPGAIPHDRDQLLNGEQQRSAVQAEVAREREPLPNGGRMDVDAMKAEACRLRREGCTLTEIIHQLSGCGPGAPKHVTTVKAWIDPVYAAKRAARHRERNAAYRERRRAAANPEPPLPFPTPPGAFTRGYRRALAAGIDLLEMLEPGNECRHGHLPGDIGHTCDCWKQNRAAIEAATVVGPDDRGGTKAAA